MIAAVVIFVALLLSWVHRRQAETTCGNNLKYIGLAIAGYHETYRRFPAPDADSHSWRIRIVPYLLASAMYEQYRFDEPWDSESNYTIDTRPLPVKDGGPDQPHGMPFPYECTNAPEASRMTAFLMFVGEDAFGKPGGYRRISEITDPLECTLIAAETIPTTIQWIEPKDFDVQTMSFVINDADRLAVSSNHKRGPAVLFADGEVYRLSPTVDAETLRAMITINGGELLDRNDLIDRGLLNNY